MTRLEQALAAVKSNPKFVRWHRGDLAFLRVEAVFFMADNQPQQAVAIFDAILKDRPSPERVLEQARSLSAFGYPDVALRRLDDSTARPIRMSSGIGMPRIHEWVLHKQGWWSLQLKELHQQLETTVARQKRNVPVETVPTSSAHPPDAN